MGGVEMMAERLIKNMISNLPPEIRENIVQIFQKVMTFEVRLNTIDAAQADISRKLDILLMIAGYRDPNQTKELTDGTDHGSGQVIRQNSPDA